MNLLRLKHMKQTRKFLELRVVYLKYFRLRLRLLHEFRLHYLILLLQMQMCLELYQIDYKTPNTYELELLKIMLQRDLFLLVGLVLRWL